MITLYAHSLSERLTYVATHLFQRVLGTEVRYTSDAAFFLRQTGACLNYSDENLHHGLQIIPNGLLKTTDIYPIADLQTAQWQGLPTIFHNGQGDVPFDLLAAAFYLLTLYGEYFPQQTDEHGRFRHQESWLYQQGILEMPIVDRWAQLLQREWEKQSCPAQQFAGRAFRVIHTYDIDLPVMSRKSYAIGLARNMLHGKMQFNDTYFDAIRMIDALHTEKQIPYYLFAMADTVRSDYHSLLLQIMNRQATIGLHPSYDCMDDFALLKAEKQQLEALLNTDIRHSRQHFLRFRTPQTFRELSDGGIREDFSLAFAKAVGFRSGTAIPHPFFDLQRNQTTTLLLRPTVMMDATLIFHQKLTPDAGYQKNQKLKNECRQSGGDYLSLWHNSNIAGSANPWQEVWKKSCSE